MNDFSKPQPGEPFWPNEITITKHFVATTLSPTYIELLRSMVRSKNNATYVINFNGQINTFLIGELKFKKFTFKQTGDDDLDITFYLASSKDLTADGQVYLEKDFSQLGL